MKEVVSGMWNARRARVGRKCDKTSQTFKQKYEIYLETSNKSEPEDKKKVAILLNLAGDRALEVYNTFKFRGVEDQNELGKVLQMFEE